MFVSLWKIQRIRFLFGKSIFLQYKRQQSIFIIGEKKLRKLVEEKADADFIIMNGNRVMIKRRLFEKYLDESTSV